MSRSRPSVLRVLVGALLLVIGVVSTPAALGAVWAAHTSTDTARFTSALVPLGTSDAVHTRLTTQVTEAITDSLPATDALSLLLGSSAGKGFLRSVVRTSLDGPAFPRVWASSVRSAHRQALAELRGDATASSTTAAGRITIPVDRLLPLLTPQVKALGLPDSFALPKTHASVTIATIPHLADAQRSYARLQTASAVLPFVAGIGLVAGVLLLRRRARAIAAAAGGILLGLAALHLAVASARAWLIAQLALPQIGRAADVLIAPLDTAAVWTAVIAAVVGLAALAVAILAPRRHRRRAVDVSEG